LDAVAKPFIEKFLKGRANGVHVLDTNEGPIEMAREIQGLASFSMFFGRPMDDIVRSLAKKAHHHDHHTVATMAHPGAQATTIFEFLKELSTSQARTHRSHRACA
jgi:hypothetical protein